MKLSLVEKVRRRPDGRPMARIQRWLVLYKPVQVKRASTILLADQIR
jgi:hypothetical protein